MAVMDGIEDAAVKLDGEAKFAGKPELWGPPEAPKASH